MWEGNEDYKSYLMQFVDQEFELDDTFPTSD